MRVNKHSRVFFDVVRMDTCLRCGAYNDRYCGCWRDRLNKIEVKDNE